MSISNTVQRQRGASLIELIMFIVIVGVALGGLLLVMDTTTRHSADPLIHKQALAIAESLLEEVELQPFTVCDPDDANVATAVTAADCASLPEAIGPEAGETRYASPYFDNVNDYSRFSMSGANGIKDVNGDSLSASGGVTAALDAYSASVSVSADALGSLTAASGDALRIKVSVTGPDGVPVVLESMRSRYAPGGP